MRWQARAPAGGVIGNTQHTGVTLVAHLSIFEHGAVKLLA